MQYIAKIQEKLKSVKKKSAIKAMKQSVKTKQIRNQYASEDKTKQHVAKRVWECEHCVNMSFVAESLN